MTMAGDGTVCPGCGARGAASLLPFFELKGVPVNSSALLTSQAAARACRRGGLDLTLCRSCALVFNRSFDAALLDYDEAYDNTLDYSPTFRAYARKLAMRLRRRHGLHNKRIIEIGSGRGGFLKLLSADGENHCVGYDPTFDPARSGGELSAVRFVRDYYGERYASEPVDFVLCRHVLEHMPRPLEFLGGLRRTLAAHGPVSVYFEVPNALQVFDGPGLWDVIYQHVQYFTAQSLQRLFRRAGFELIDSGLSFGDQYLWVEARATPAVRAAPCAQREGNVALERIVTDFADRFRDTLRRWGARLRRWKAEGKRDALWGAGTKGATFLNVVEGAAEIPAVVDLNPRKQGMYVPGTGQRISAPSELARRPPQIVITLNPAYVEEIGAMLGELRIPAKVATFSTVMNS